MPAEHWLEVSYWFMLQPPDWQGKIPAAITQEADDNPELAKKNCQPYQNQALVIKHIPSQF